MKDEAMKQWLEALEDFVDVIKYDNEQDDIGRRACCDVLSYNPHREDCKAIKSIASLRQAIAELESQEPVAWRIKVETKLRDGSVDVGYQLRNEKMSAYDEPLYNHPPQRTEQNFCPRCGKRTNDIHTCTPPKHTEQEPVGFAGIEMWIGNTRIKKLMTQTELHFAIDPWAIVKFNSDSCIDALKEKNT